MTRRNGRLGIKWNRAGLNPTPVNLNATIAQVSAFNDVLVVTGSNLLSIPEPANNFYQVRVIMASGAETSGYMENLSRTNQKIRMRLRPDIFEWREGGPGSAHVEVKNMRRIVVISPLQGFNKKIHHPGSTLEPAPGGYGISPFGRIRSMSKPKSKGRRRQRKGLRGRRRRMR